MTELRPAIEVTGDILAKLSFTKKHADVTTIITADRLALVDAIVAMLRDRGSQTASDGRFYAFEFADLIAQRFGGSQ